MSVGRICTREVDIAHGEESVWRAAERMHQRTVGALVVLNEGDEPIGIVTDRDLTVRVLAQGRDSHTTQLAEVMTRDPETIVEDAPIELALLRMRRGAFRRLPVVDAKGKFVGVLALDDVLMLMAEEFAEIGRLLRNETPRAAAEAAALHA
jgi:CBS domain-containing protein